LALSRAWDTSTVRETVSGAEPQVKMPLAVCAAA